MITGFIFLYFGFGKTVLQICPFVNSYKLIRLIMTQKQLRALAGKALDYLMSSGKYETYISIPKALTDKQLDFLENQLYKFNAEVDFNQLYNEKTDELVKDKKVLVIGVRNHDRFFS